MQNTNNCLNKHSSPHSASYQSLSPSCLPSCPVCVTLHLVLLSLALVIHFLSDVLQLTGFAACLDACWFRLSGVGLWKHGSGPLDKKRVRETFNHAKIDLLTQPERPGARNHIYEAHYNSDEICAEPWQASLEPATEKLGRVKGSLGSWELGDAWIFARSHNAEQRRWELPVHATPPCVPKPDFLEALRHVQEGFSFAFSMPFLKHQASPRPRFSAAAFACPVVLSRLGWKPID